MYPDPDTFNPDRYLGEQPALDPRQYVFGVGRRVCPGNHFAEAAIFAVVSLLLATTNVVKKKDEMGKEIEPVLKFTGSFGK